MMGDSNRHGNLVARGNERYGENIPIWECFSLTYWVVYISS